MDAPVKNHQSDHRQSGWQSAFTSRIENIFVNRATSIAVVSVTLLMVLLICILYQIEESNLAARIWVLHSREVKEHALTLLTEMGDAELSHNAYMMTGDKAILIRYNQLVQGLDDSDEKDGTKILPHTLAEELYALKHLTVDNSTQQKNLENVTVSLKKLMGYMASTLEATRNGSAKIGVSSMDFQVRETLMRPVHAGFNAVLEEENHLLTEREQAERAWTRRSNSLIFTGMAIFYAVVVLAIWLCQKAERRTKTQSQQQAVYLKTVLDTIIDGLLVIDHKGTVESFNPAAERMFGYKSEEVIGKNIKMLMPEPYHGEHDGYLKNYLTTGQAKIIGIGREVTAKRKDGSTFPIELGVSEMRVGNKRLFAGIIRDVTKRKEAELATRLLAAIVESAEEAIIGKTLDGKITSWNEGAEKLLGYRAADVIGKPVSILVPPERMEEEKSIMAELRKGQKVFHLETLRMAYDGTRIDVSITLSAIRDGSGKVIGASTIMRDIRAQKKADREIQQHISALKQSNQELDDFAYIASHDLKEPLRGLVSNAMFLKEDFSDKLDGATTRRLDRMTYLCQRMEKLMDDLLYFSRLGRQKLAVQRTDLNEIIKDIKLSMETTLCEANAVIEMPETLPTIICDLPRITEIFRNLISNAIKYNKSAEKHIEIGCADTAEQAADNDNIGCAFYVRDNGIGIPEQFHNDIFRIFKRLNEEDESVKGTGAGLTFVRKIVERHGGRIWLHSEVGKGTTFYFTLNTNMEAAS